MGLIRSSKQNKKRITKRSAVHAVKTVKTVLWAVGRLKNKKRRRQIIRKPGKQGRSKKTRQGDQTRPDVPKGTVAD